MAINQHTVRAFDDDLDGVRNKVVEMGGMVEAQITDAIEALVKRNDELARATASNDQRIDDMENVLEEMTVRLMVKRQPMADDLRHVVSALRAAAILERVGDYAAHVAKRALVINQFPAMPPVRMISRMGVMVRELFGDAIGAYARRDPELALSVWRRDRELDEMCASLLRELLEHMKQDTESIATCVELLFVAKYIERMGDFATNLAESVHFLVLGRRPEGERPKASPESQ